MTESDFDTPIRSTNTTAYNHPRSYSLSDTESKTEPFRTYTTMATLPPSTRNQPQVQQVSFSGKAQGPKVAAQVQVGDPTKKLYSYNHNGLVYSFDVKGQSLGFTEAQWLEIINKAENAMASAKLPTGKAFSMQLGSQTIVHKDRHNRDLAPIAFQRQNAMQDLYDALEKHSGVKIHSKNRKLNNRVTTNPKNPTVTKTHSTAVQLTRVKKKKSSKRPPQPVYYSSDSEFESDTEERLSKSYPKTTNTTATTAKKKDVTLPLHSREIARRKQQAASKKTSKPNPQLQQQKNTSRTSKTNRSPNLDTDDES